MKPILKSLILCSSLFVATAASAADAITTTSLNFRSGPGTNYSVLGAIPAGQSVTVSNCAGNWCQISYGTRSGFASSSYLAFREAKSVYNNYRQPRSSFNVIIAPGYRDRHYNRPFFNGPIFNGPRPPMGMHRPPPPPPPHWNSRPPQGHFQRPYH